MRRTEVLQGLRLMKPEEINDRLCRGRLSASEAAVWLGASERTFRRLRGRYEEEGPSGLLDRRLGKASPHRIAADEVERVVRCIGTAMPAGRSSTSASVRETNTA